MAYDEYLGERISYILTEKKLAFETKKMMGGLCFMMDGKMLTGVVKNELMARIGPDAYQAALEKEGCKEMNFTGRAMKGYVFLDPEATDMDDDLAYWLQLCIDYNPFAKASKKRKRVSPKKS